MYVRALYDFEPVNVEELPFKKNEVIRVTRQNVGGGWWEGVKDDILGLFPADYVLPIDSSEIDDSSGESEGEAETGQDVETPSPFSFGKKILNKKPGGSSTIMLQKMEEISLDENGWVSKRDAFTVSITKADKVKKNTLQQAYILYEVKSELNPMGVMRRFKNFEWLHDRLTEKYPFVIVPPLPDKQLQGRFEIEFVQQRRRRLERFINRIASHPVLRNSVVFHHFLTTSDSKDWKYGKRQAEIQAIPHSILDSIKLQAPPKEDHGELIDKFLRFVRSMEKHIHSLQNISDHLHSKTEGIENDYSEMSVSWEHLVTSDEDKGLKVIGLIRDQLVRTKDRPNEPFTAMNNAGCWCWKGACTECAPLSISLFQLSSTLVKISNSSKELSGFSRLSEQLKDLDREIRRFPTIIKLYENCVNAYRTAQTKDKEQNLPLLKQRADTAALAVVSEIGYFHRIRIQDLKVILQEFLLDQINLHYKVAQLWEDLLPSVEDIDPHFM